MQKLINRREVSYLSAIQIRFYSISFGKQKTVKCRDFYGNKTNSDVKRENCLTNERSFSSVLSHRPEYPLRRYELISKPQTLLRQKNEIIKSKQIWGWLNSVFNRVDESRILDAGPDRACAEWLLRCGAGVKWVNSKHFVKDYNSLPIGGSRSYKIEEVDGTNSAVMHIGFPYFKNCKSIRRVVFHKATYLDDEALNHLDYLKKSLKELQISSCGNVSKEGLSNIKKLKNLEHLLLYDLPLIKDKEEIKEDLQEALPNCTIEFPYAQASEKPTEDEAMG